MVATTNTKEPFTPFPICTSTLPPNQYTSCFHPGCCGVSLCWVSCVFSGADTCTHRPHIYYISHASALWVLRGASIKVSICGVKGGVLPNPHPPGTDPALSKWGQQATCASGMGIQTDGGWSRGVGSSTASLQRLYL